MNPAWKTEFRALHKLALPVITVQVGTMLMGFVDTIMVGQFAETHLAAAALANFYTFVAMMFGTGVLMALDPVMSQAVGAGDEAAMARNFQRGVVLAGALCVPVVIIYLFAGPLLTLAGQKPALVPLATDYIWKQIPGVLPFYLFSILRTTQQAHHQTAPVVWTILAANLVNVGLNWMLIFGHAGFAPMGLGGSGIATMASRWVMFLVLLFVGRKTTRRYLTPWTPAATDRRALSRILRVGAPIGVQIVLEFGAFGTTLLFMGWISVSALAGHQIAINLASMTYMFPLGLSVATGVRVGHGVGRGDLTGARWSAVLGLGLGVLLMLGFAAAFLRFPETLTDWFIKSDTEVGARDVCLLLLPIAAVFQVVDGLQVVSLGVLRGVGDTKVPMFINLLGFWCLGIPVGAWLAFQQNMGPEGLWWGLTVGLTAVAVFLLARVWFKLRDELVRTEIDPVEVGAD